MDDNKVLHVLRLQASNVLRLKAVDITATDGIVKIVGKNAQGKSSVLDSIWLAMKSAMVKDVTDPLRHGEDRGHIKLTLGNGGEAELLVTRRFSSTGRAELTVESADGKSKFNSPQAILDALIGDATADPLAYKNMHPGDQLDRLRKLVQLPIDVDAEKKKNADDYTGREVINRQERQKRAAAQEKMRGGKVERIPADPIREQLAQANDLAERIRQLTDEKSTVNFKIEQSLSALDTMRSKLAAAREAIIDLEARIKAGEEHVAKMREEVAKIEIPAPVDVTSAMAALEAARASHVRADEYEAGVKLEGEADELAKESRAITARMKAREEAIAQALSEAKFPIEGLAFGEGCVLYKGSPLKQASSREQIEACMAIVLAAKPRFRVVCIRHGSLVDEDGEREIAEIAAKYGAQTWFEKVGTGIPGILIEDGEVKDGQG